MFVCHTLNHVDVQYRMVPLLSSGLSITDTLRSLDCWLIEVQMLILRKK